MDLSFLLDFITPITLGLCLAIGYIIKEFVKKVDNKYIPVVVSLIGVGVSIWVNDFAFTPEILLAGLVNGLASTGLYEVYAQLFIKKVEK